MGDVAHAIGHARDGRVQVQLAAVVGRPLVAGEVQPQVAEGLVGFLSDRIAEELLADERHGLGDLAFEHQPPDLVPMAAGPLTHVIVRPPGPEGVLVELDALVRRPSEDHRPESPAADRQGFLPGTRRLRIPEPQVSGPGIGRGARASASGAPPPGPTRPDRVGEARSSVALPSFRGRRALAVIADFPGLCRA